MPKFTVTVINRYEIEAASEADIRERNEMWGIDADGGRVVHLGGELAIRPSDHQEPTEEEEEPSEPSTNEPDAAERTAAMHAEIREAGR